MRVSRTSIGGIESLDLGFFQPSMKRWTERRELRKKMLLERGQRVTDP
jgi:hypothetical protein